MSNVKFVAPTGEVLTELPEEVVEVIIDLEYVIVLVINKGAEGLPYENIFIETGCGAREDELVSYLATKIAKELDARGLGSTTDVEAVCDYELADEDYYNSFTVVLN